MIKKCITLSVKEIHYLAGILHVQYTPLDKFKILVYYIFAIVHFTNTTNEFKLLVTQCLFLHISRWLYYILYSKSADLGNHRVLIDVFLQRPKFHLPNEIGTKLTLFYIRIDFEFYDVFFQNLKLKEKSLLVIFSIFFNVANVKIIFSVKLNFSFFYTSMMTPIFMFELMFCD